MKKVTRIGMIIMVLVLATSLTASAAGFVNPGTGSADVAVMNVGSSAATVTAEYIDSTGATVVEKTRTGLPVNGTHEFLASGSGLPDGWQGAMLLSSTEVVASVATIRWNGGVDAGDDGATGQYEGASAGSTTVYCPALYQNANLYSTMAIQNTGTSDASVQIAFRDRAGAAYGSNPVTRTIKPNAQATVNLSTEAAFFAVSTKDGSAVITSNQPVAVVATTHWAGRSSAYNCPTTGATKLYVPAQYRVKTADSTFSAYTMFSANVLMNLSSSATAHVTFHYVPRTAGGPTLNVPLEIPALSAKGLNTYNGGSVLASTFDVLGNSWDGTVVVDSDQPLVGINNTVWGPVSGERSATFKILTPSDGATAVYLPHAHRIKSGSNWLDWSAAIVQNLSTSTANVKLQYYNASGTKVLEINQAIDAGAAYGFNTRNGGSVAPSTFDPLGDSYKGGVKVTSDQAIAVASQFITAGASKITGSAYNGIAVQ